MACLSSVKSATSILSCKMFWHRTHERHLLTMRRLHWKYCQCSQQSIITSVVKGVCTSTVHSCLYWVLYLNYGPAVDFKCVQYPAFISMRENLKKKSSVCTRFLPFLSKTFVDLFHLSLNYVIYSIPFYWKLDLSKK